jgi:hypothetical protein
MSPSKLRKFFMRKGIFIEHPFSLKRPLCLLGELVIVITLEANHDHQRSHSPVSGLRPFQ